MLPLVILIQDKGYYNHHDLNKSASFGTELANCISYHIHVHWKLNNHALICC